MKLKRVVFFRELKHGDEFGASLKESVRDIPLEDEKNL